MNPAGRDSAETDVWLTLASQGRSRTVGLYSEEGRDLVATLWVKVAAQFRVMYEPTWLGIPIIQLPSDIVMLQELLWTVRPDVVVETGVAHGGSAMLYASILDMIGQGSVVGVDVEIRTHNREAIESHPLAHRITLVEGSSVAPETVAEVERLCAGRRAVVILDSNHSTEHVLREMELYQGLVCPGGYLVVMDGAQANVWDIPRGKPEWREDNPLIAIRTFLRDHPEFIVDPRYTRLHVTSSPEGFLRRLTPEEMA